MKRRRHRGGGGGGGGGGALQAVQQAAKARGTEVVFQPAGMTRHEANSSSYDRKHNVRPRRRLRSAPCRPGQRGSRCAPWQRIVWHVEWVFGEMRPAPFTRVNEGLTLRDAVAMALGVDVPAPPPPAEASVAPPAAGGPSRGGRGSGGGGGGGGGPGPLRWSAAHRHRLREYIDGREGLRFFIEKARRRHVQRASTRALWGCLGERSRLSGRVRRRRRRGARRWASRRRRSGGGWSWRAAQRSRRRFGASGWWSFRRCTLRCRAARTPFPPQTARSQRRRLPPTGG